MWNNLKTWWDNTLLISISAIGVLTVAVFMIFVTLIMCVLLPLQSAGIVDDTEAVVETAYPFIWLTMLALLAWVTWSTIT